MSEIAEITTNQPMQVQQKSTHIQSFGGINFINHYLNQTDFASIIMEELGKRHPKAQYSYSQLIKQLFYIALMGGETLDESGVLKEQLADHPNLQIASADTIEYAFQELRQADRKVKSPSGAVHQINEHNGFNRILPQLAKHLHLFNSEQGYMLDYDGHVVKNTKHDNAKTYKNNEGYYPVVCSINKIPVHMQNRNGNTPESYGQRTVIEQAIAACRRNDISVDFFRADACCYEKKTIEYLESEEITYYIRAEQNQRLLDALIDEPDWMPAKLGGHRNVEVCSVEEPVLGQKRTRRIVAYRYKPKGQLSISDVNGYRYSAVITSDKEHSALECIEVYNHRGCEGEHHFKELDHDFNWRNLPFDNMAMNTIYLYATMMGYLLFNAVKQRCSRNLKFVNIKMQMKSFILHFVTLPAKWIRSGRRDILKIFTKKDYSPLWNP